MREFGLNSFTHTHNGDRVPQWPLEDYENINCLVARRAVVTCQYITESKEQYMSRVPRTKGPYSGCVLEKHLC